MSESPLPSPELIHEEACYPAWRQRFGRDLAAAGFRCVGASDRGERWEGYLGVDWDDPETDDYHEDSHAIRILLPPAFPFAKPKIIPLDDDPPVRDSRHQAPGDDHGALCLWSDDGDGWSPTITADGVLERVRTWFIHYHRDDWQQADRPPDLHLYFPTRSPRPLMFISDDWVLPEQGNTGRFGVWQKDSQRAFAGAPQTGCSAPPRQHDDRALSILGLSESTFALRGIWFRLHGEPRPCTTLQALLAEIDAAACQQEGWAVQQLIGLYGPKVRKGKQDQAILALGYPDGNGTEQWLFVRARLSDGADITRWSQVGFLRRTVVESFETAPLHRDALMRRTGHIAQHLATRQVLIFGQGSIGSSISLLLAKAGVPRLRLVDRDRMRPGNTVRHICGLHFAGYDKTRAVQVKVQSHAPDCEVVTETATWNPVDLARWIDEADVVVDATAHRSFSLLLNALCVRAHRTAVYVTAHRRATIGRIRIVRPGQDACLVCYEGGYLENDAYPVIPPGDEGAFIERGCGDPTIEASAVDAEATANWAARLVLWLLQDKGSDINHCLVVNEPIMEAHADLSRVGVHMSQWAPLPGCEACDRERQD